MKKRRTCIWLCMLLAVVSHAFAAPLTEQDALALISNHLTEVYSYTAEEAAAFHARAEWENDHWRIFFSPADHPDWTYSATWQEGDVRIQNVITPLWHNEKPQNYPGEGSVREGLRRARENGWFVIWEAHMREALWEYMKTFEIIPTARLREGLASGSITAGNALHEYFVSCYGDEMNWTPELKQWHDEEMESYGFTYSKADVVGEGVVSYTTKEYRDLEVERTHFVAEVPETLLPVFEPLTLEGWTCLCGATAQNVINRYGYGLAAFEKEGQRLLVGLRTKAESEEWIISPISKQALYTDKEMYILPAEGTNKNKFTIVYQNSETETEQFEVFVGGVDGTRLDASITRYIRMDEATGSGLALVIDSGVRAITYKGHEKTGEEIGPRPFSTAMSMTDINRFPTTIEAWKNAEQDLIPEGYALVRGVHLRQKTSSRSKDLGDYQHGVLAKVLGTEPGDPWPWYHVQIGLAEGYMASSYVNEVVTQDTGYTLDRSLPIAQAQKEIRLKKGTSWLSGTVQTIPEGTQMHVLAHCDGGWLHVSIPQGKIGWQMDLNGTDGYVKETDVRIGGTPLAFEWME